MAVSKKRHAGRPPLKPGVAKRAMNISLDPDVLARAQVYSARHETSISQLVGDFLRALPLDGDAERLTPVVRRLRGVGVGIGAAADHHAHLATKHGLR